MRIPETRRTYTFSLCRTSKVLRGGICLSLMPPKAEKKPLGNDRLPSDTAYATTPLARYQDNMEAIRLLKKIESGVETASPEKQDVLAKYTGWGGLVNWSGTADMTAIPLRRWLTRPDWKDRLGECLSWLRAYLPRHETLKVGEKAENGDDMLMPARCGLKIYDYVTNEKGNKVARVNKNETIAAQAKQAEIKDAFRDWVFKDPVRRANLVCTYNERFNSIRLREFNGSYLTFPGMATKVASKFRPYQKNCAVRSILNVAK